MKMDVWNYINYLHHEQATLKAKYENLTNLVQEIFDAVKHTEMKRIEKNKQKKSKTKCRYYNRGYCKEGESCDFLHPSEVCQEYVYNGSCPQRNRCQQRHPQSCKFWEQGDCWRGETCAYLHKEKDVDSENDHEEISDEEKDDATNEIQEATLKGSEENYAQESEDFSHSLSTDEIIKMYENVEIDLNDTNQISTDDILRMLENDNNVEESCNVQKSTRKNKTTSRK